MAAPVVATAGIYESENDEAIVASGKELRRLYDAIQTINWAKLMLMNSLEVELTSDGTIELRLKEVVLT
jgi:hypothetical protein